MKNVKEQQLIWDFIKSNSVFNLATSKNGQAYGSTCYYGFDAENKIIIFKSAEDSRHIEEGLKMKLVGGTILPDKLKIGIIKGVQFQGELFVADIKFPKAKKKYYKTHPYAITTEGTVYAIELSYIKFTDNKLGFGKKLIWEQ